MSNMSYCRFQNTNNDLADCAGALEEIFSGEHGKLSREELAAAKALVEQCYHIIQLVADNSAQTDVELVEFELDSAEDALNKANEANEDLHE